MKTTHLHMRVLAGVGLGALVLAADVAAAADAQATRLLQQVARLNGADQVAALEFAGKGSWYQFGQAPAPGLDWPRFDVSDYRATADFAAVAGRVRITRLQAIEPGRARPAPVEQKVDQYVAGDVAWNVPTGGNTTPSAQPAAVEERRAEIWSTPQGFVRAALAHEAALVRGKDGASISFTDGAYRYEGVIDRQKNVSVVRTWIDNPVLGDTPYETRFSNYSRSGTLSFPARIERSLGGHPILALDVVEVKSIPSGAVAAPANLAAAQPPEVKVTPVAPGVFYLTGGTHHSVLVDEGDHLVVIEAPQNEARSLAVIAKARELAPGKPITHVINTHTHFDHSGGLRTYADAGAVIVTDAANRAFYEQAWAAPRTLNPDRLARSGRAARFETFTGKYSLAGPHPIEVHAITGSGHNDAFSLVYLPADRLLIEADAYTPLAANAPAPTSLNPYTVNLLDNVERLKLDVAQIAALHGPRLVAFKDLRATAGRPAPTPSPENSVVDVTIPGVVKSGTPITYVAGGFDGTEGPLPLADGSLILTENRVDRIQRIAADGSVSLFAEGNLNPNALALAPDGTIVAAQTARPGIGVVYPADKARALVTSQDGKPFNRPNDLIVDSRGAVWFTDPGPGPAQRAPGATEPAEKPVPAVYRLSERGELARLATDIARPNGITLSLDEKTLYVANTYGESVLAYDVGADGTVSRRRDFAKLEGFAASGNGPASSGADGLAIDAAGRLYVASAIGVQVFSPRGRALGTIKLPRPPQNLAFAGTDKRDLYVVGRGAVWKIRTDAAGPANRAK